MTLSAQYLADPGASPDEEAQIARLQAENLALQSLLQGLCVALSQMSELHREVVIQACEHARRAPGAQALNGAEGSQPGAEAYNNVVAQLRAAIMDRYRSF